MGQPRTTRKGERQNHAGGNHVETARPSFSTSQSPSSTPTAIAILAQRLALWLEDPARRAEKLAHLAFFHQPPICHAA